MRVVLDANVLVSALLTPGGPAHRVMTLVVRGHLQLCVDSRIIEEYRGVLGRGKFSFPSREVKDLLEALLFEAQEVIPAPVSSKLLDETDRAFIEAAVAGQVVALVTGNVRHFHIAQTLGIPVRSPSEFLLWFGRNR